MDGINFSQTPYLHLVTPDDTDLHIQLVSENKIDKVHPIKGIDHLIETRLGFPGYTKQCYALIQKSSDDAREILAAIYTYWSSPQDADETWRILPGRVSDILREPSQPLKGDPTVVTFYSISSFANGGGKQLISELHKAFTQAGNSPILTTLSPLRTFREWVDTTGQVIEDNIEAFRQAAARYLGMKVDPTQKFHLGNGAYVGAIHPYANEPGTLDDQKGLRVMVSYRYPRTSEALQANVQDYRAGAIPASGHLRPLLNT